MKKLLILLFILSVTFVGYYFINDSKDEATKTQGKPTHQIIDAKGKSFESLTDLENDSSVIVLGEKLDGTNIFKKNEDQNIIEDIGTLSNFKISKLIKNTSDQKIKVSSTIKVMEDQAIDEKENKVYHVSGYELMKKNKKYLLYLTPTPDGYYVIQGTTFGKVPQDIAEKNFAEEQSNSKEEIIIKEAQKKYFQ